jgi:hypothetical protein
MIEGKFKERIRAYYKRHQHLVAVEVPDEIKEWIDEAKKEFPIYGNIEEELLKKRQIFPVKDAQEEFVHAVYNWFEKWFGDMR